MMFGIDLSSADAPPSSFEKLRAEIDFAYVRVFRSNGLEDPMWWSYYTGLTGVERAPYLFLRPPAEQLIEDQVRTFLGYLQARGKPLPAWEWGPVLDIEYSTAQRARYGAPPLWVVQQAIAELRAQSGQDRLWCYLGHEDLTNGLAPAAVATDNDIRLIGARYVANDPAAAFTNLGVQDRHLDIVQYWDNASLPGLTGAVDVNTGIIKKGNHMSVGATWDLIDQAAGHASAVLPLGDNSTVAARGWVSVSSQWGAARPIQNVIVTALDNAGRDLQTWGPFTAQWNGRWHEELPNETAIVTVGWTPNVAEDSRGAEDMVLGLEVLPK